VTATAVKHDPRLDLVLQRVVDVPPELVWAAWTVPHHVKKWFTPAPWKTVDCEIDLRPGSIFRTVMRSPEGQDITNVGCFLEIVPNRKLVWTVALQPGYRPSNPTFDIPAFTAIITLEPHGKGDEIRRACPAQGRGGPQRARPHGLQRGLGQGARSARRPCEGDVGLRWVPEVQLSM